MFDGKAENRPKPRELSGSDLLQQLEVVKDNSFKKHLNKRKGKENA